MSLTKSEFDKICRICLEQETSLTSILTTEILNMFHTCTTIRIENDDKLPSNICSYCLNKLQNVFLFNQQCEKSDHTLRQLVECDNKLLFDQQFENSNYKYEQLFDCNDKSWLLLENEESEAKPNILAEPKKESNENPILYSLLHELDENKPINIKCEQDSTVDQKPQIDLDDGNSSHHVQSFYTCELCLERYLTETELAEHTQTEHKSPHQEIHQTNNGNFKCQQCSQYFATELLLKQHVTCVHEVTCNNSILCGVCGTQTSSNYELMIHNMLIHTDKNPELLKSVVDTQIDDDPLFLDDYSTYECKTCQEEFCGIRELVKHTQTEHKVNSVTCSECNKTFTVEIELKIHMQYVHGKYMCTDCNKTFTKASTLKQHLIVHSEDRPFSCVQCHKTFKYADGLKTHEFRAHSDQARQKCDMCGKEVFDLKAHREISHSAEKPFQCDRCSKCFAIEVLLKNHIRYRHDKSYNTRTALCNICGLICDNAASLQLHMRVHTGEKPFKCDLCDKTFRYKHILVSHKTTHTDERAFNCKICDKALKSSKSLKRHMIIHTDKRPYVCNICSKAFNQSSILKRHMRVHDVFEKSK